MAKIGIVADSSVCLPKELVEKYKIELVPEVINFGDRVYRDGINLVPHDFYVMLGKAKELPTTSAPSPQDFIDAYQIAARGKDAVFCILVTPKFSQMGWQAAMTARKSISQPQVELMDSRTAVGAYGFIVLAAARAAAEGKPLPEVVKAARDVQKRVTVILTLETLKYLAKGGRIGKAAHWAGTMLNIKPILEVPVSVGAIEPLERVRSRPRALRRLLEIMRERVGEGKQVHVSVDHANVLGEAQWLKEQVSSMFDCAEVYINDWTPVAGVHCGPGVIGLSFYAGDQ
jgi:DegV family protein with EDD domain